MNVAGNNFNVQILCRTVEGRLSLTKCYCSLCTKTAIPFYTCIAICKVCDKIPDKLFQNAYQAFHVDTILWRKISEAHVKVEINIVLSKFSWFMIYKIFSPPKKGILLDLTDTSVVMFGGDFARRLNLILISWWNCLYCEKVKGLSSGNGAMDYLKDDYFTFYKKYVFSKKYIGM